MNPISSELCLDPLLSPTSKGQPLESKALEKSISSSQNNTTPEYYKQNVF